MVIPSLRDIQPTIRRVLSETLALTVTPDSIIAPWLTRITPETLWVIGEQVPPIVIDFSKSHKLRLECFKWPNRSSEWPHKNAKAALLVDPVTTNHQITIGSLRNRLINEILCFVEGEVDPSILFALGFTRGLQCEIHYRECLSFHYSLTTYNHNRVWNNPKNWANPENWNKYWW